MMYRPQEHHRTAWAGEYFEGQDARTWLGLIRPRRPSTDPSRCFFLDQARRPGRVLSDRRNPPAGLLLQPDSPLPNSPSRVRGVRRWSMSGQVWSRTTFSQQFLWYTLAKMTGSGDICAHNVGKSLAEWDISTYGGKDISPSGFHQNSILSPFHSSWHGIRLLQWDYPVFRVEAGYKHSMTIVSTLYDYRFYLHVLSEQPSRVCQVWYPIIWRDDRVRQWTEIGRSCVMHIMRTADLLWNDIESISSTGCAL